MDKIHTNSSRMQCKDGKTHHGESVQTRDRITGKVSFNNITAFIFVVDDLSTLKCRVYVAYGFNQADYLGKVQPYQHEKGYIFTDADNKPLFNVKGFGVIDNSHKHGTPYVISLMHDFAKEFIDKINELEMFAAIRIEDIGEHLKNAEFYAAHPLTAYVRYVPLSNNTKGDRNQMKLCGCKEPCFEIGEQRGYLGCPTCKHRAEKVDGAGNGLITFCMKFNTPVETYNTEEQHDQLISNRQKTKDILTRLAEKLACNTSCNNIRNFMECFKNIDVHSENFNQCCIMFRHAVNIALKLDKNLNMVPGVSALRLATDIEIDGSAISRAHNGIVIAKGCYGNSQCEKCALANGKIPCEGNIYADNFGYVVRNCNQYQDSKINTLLKNFDDVCIPNVYVTNSKLTIPFTKYGYIEILAPKPDTIKTVYAIIDQFRPFFYFREAITSNGSINIWIYETLESYKDHIDYILNNCKHNKKEEKENK